MSVKRDASSPAAGSEEDLKRRFTVGRLSLGDNSDSSSDTDTPTLTSTVLGKEDEVTERENYQDATDIIPEAQEESTTDQAAKTLSKLKDTSDPPKSATLDDKVDILTTKIDKIMDYLACKDTEALNREQRNLKKFKKIEKAHNEVLDVVQKNSSDISSVQSKIAQNSISIECNEETIASVNTRLKIQQTATDDMEERMKGMAKAIQGLQQDLDHANMIINDHSLEIRERKLLLSKVTEPKNEDCELTALTNLNKVLSYAILQEKPDVAGVVDNPKFRMLVANDIDMAYRIGSTNNSHRVRDLVVTLKFNKLRQMVMDAKSFVKKGGINFFVSEYLTNDAKTLRAKLKTIAVGAKSLGYETKLSGNKISIGKETYTAEELNSLPSTILDESKQQRIVTDGIAYKGDSSIFSNFFPSTIIVDDVEFVSVEQYFQYTKAISCKAEHLAMKIKSKSSPWYAKAVGKRVDVTDDWNKESMEVLYRGVYAKFDQNSLLKQKLLQTVGQNLYEATTDPYWGCGIDLISPKWESGDWNGNNVGGKIVMKVRDEFLNEEVLGNTNDNTLANLLHMNTDTTDMDWQHNTSSNKDTSISSHLQHPLKPKPQRRSTNKGSQSKPSSGLDGNSDWPLPHQLQQQLQQQKQQQQQQNQLQPSPTHLSKSYTDAVKSPEAITNSKQCSFDNFNKNKGKAAQGRGKPVQLRKPARRNQLSQQDVWFLQGKGNSTRRQSGRGGGEKPPEKRMTQNQNRDSKKDWSNSLNLSVTQREAVAYLGLEPDSEFVRNAISSHLKK